MITIKNVTISMKKFFSRLKKHDHHRKLYDLDEKSFFTFKKNMIIIENYMIEKLRNCMKKKKFSPNAKLRNTLLDKKRMI